jgi:hypothetical protein
VTVHHRWYAMVFVHGDSNECVYSPCTLGKDEGADKETYFISSSSSPPRVLFPPPLLAIALLCPIPPGCNCSLGG